MKNSKLRRVLLLLASAVLLVSLSVGATLAYLTDSKSVTNTFVVGHVTITLDELKVKPDGTEDTTATSRVTANEYKLFPNHEYIKDPTVHIDDESEDCWVFVKVENGIADIEADDNTIAAQLTDNGWSLVAGETNVYAYERIATKDDANIVVFESFKIADTVDNIMLAEYADATVVVTAYAVQADGFATAQAAWDDTFGK